MVFPRTGWILGLFAAVALSALSASAQDRALHPKGQGMEAHLFRPAVDTKGLFSVDSTPVLPHLAISLGLMLDFGFNDWVAVEAQRNKDIYELTMVETYISSALVFNLGLADMMAIGFQIPLVIPSGTAFNGYETKGNKQVALNSGWSTKGGIGDIAVHAKLRWLRADRRPVGVGTVVMYQAPIGKSELLMGEPGGGALSGKMIFDVEPRAWYRAALNIGARVPLGYEKGNKLNKEDFAEGIAANKGKPLLLYKYGPMLTFGLGHSFSLWPEVLDFAMEIYGSHLFSEISNLDYFSTEINGGFKLFVERNSYLMAGYAHGLPLSTADSHYGFQSVEHRLFLGFAFEPSIGDKDFDNIKDDLDKCPLDPEDRDGFEDLDGCPDPDNDRDGLFDADDECPLVPEDKDGDADEDGCPERGPNDRDGDGLRDDADQCPDEPEDLDQFEDLDGCPDTDNDKDGILDINDLCPNEPEDMDGFEDENGCPDPDNDKDRILDVKDSCPNEPETYNGKDDTDGCPDQGDVILSPTEIKILKKIYFEYDSAVIKPVSYDILDAVAATMINNPQIDSVEVQGHADERGDDEYNLKLTSDRAAAVMVYLVKKGVKEAKLRAVGYGEYCPIEPASNEAAWEKNRRVEFKVISIDGQPTAAAPACDAAKAKGVGAKSK